MDGEIIIASFENFTFYLNSSFVCLNVCLNNKKEISNASTFSLLLNIMMFIYLGEIDMLKYG